MRRPEERASRKHRATRRFSKLAVALGKKVRQLRQEREWTLEETADRANLDWKHLQKVEAGLLNVTLVTLDRLAFAFKVTVAELFSEEKR